MFEITRKKNSHSKWSEQFLVAEYFFNLFLLSDMINWNNSNSNWKKLLGFRNMQEKLEMVH